MRIKIARPYGIGEIFNATWDASLRILKVILYGWDGTNAQALKVNAQGQLDTGTTTISHGRKTVTAAGTAEALGNSTAIKKVIITALESNTDVVVIGTSGVLAGVTGGGTTRTGIPLQINQSVEIDIDNLSKVYVDAVITGEGVSFAYFT